MIQHSSKQVPGKLWTVQGVLAGWGCIILLRAGYELCKNSVTQENQSEMQQADGTTGSPCQSWDGQCDEVHLFRSWQGGKAGLEEELLDLHESGLDELAQQVEQNLSANGTKVTAGVPEAATGGTGNVSTGASDQAHGLVDRAAEGPRAGQELAPTTWGQ